MRNFRKIGNRRNDRNAGRVLKMGKEGQYSGYSVFTRLMFIIENKGLYLEKYMKDFEVSKRTAYRDIEFIRTYKNYDLVLENGRYNLIVID